MNCDDNVGLHLAHEICRQVVHQGTIHVEAVPVADRSKDSRQGHSRTALPTNRAVVEHMGLSRNQIRGHTTEGDGQVVERFYRRVSQRFPVNKKADLMSRIQSGRKRHPSFETDGQVVLNCARILLTSERKILEGVWPPIINGQSIPLTICSSSSGLLPVAYMPPTKPPMLVPAI